MKANIFRNKANLTRGFTLIELLVVVSIIGMLASVILVSLQGARNKARDIKLIAEVKELQKALELYRLDNGKYPGALESGIWHTYTSPCGGNNMHLITENGLFDNSFTSKYMPVLPTELASCGIWYTAFSGSAESSELVCATPPNSLIHADGYDGANNKVSETYAYVFMITTIANPPNTNYPVVVFKNNGVYTPDYNSKSRCILGPKL